MLSEALTEHLGYLAVFIGALLEGETVLFIAGVAAQHGYVSLAVVIAVAAFGGFLSDQTLFFVGRRYGNRLLARFPSMAARASRLQAFVKRWDVAAVVLVRFIYGMRIAGPIAIGSSGIALWRLVVFDLLGAALWASLVAGLGYFIGQGLQYWFGRLHREHLLLLMAAVLFLTAAAIVMVLRRRRAAIRG